MVLQAAQPEAPHTVPSPPAGESSARQHLLTVNVEDYFQVGVFQKYIQAEHWYRFESRLRQNVDQVLDLLDRHNTQATFFVLGWTAENDPQLVRSIADAGHEVASRGFLHQKLHELTPQRIREDLTRSKAILEDVTGDPVDGFRLSDGWVTRESLWLLDEIAAAGYRYDSSLLPRHRDFADDPQWRGIRAVSTKSGSLLEVPLTTMPVPGGWLPIAGGNYHRQIPDFLMRRLVNRSVDSQTDPYVMYFHVWELDEKQPELSVASRLTKLRHYRKLGKYRRILPQYLERHHFTSIQRHAHLANSPLQALKRPVEEGRNVRQHLASTATRLITDSCSSDTSESVQKTDTLRNSDHVSRTDLADITLVIPCFNEERTVRYLANTLNSVTNRLSDQYAVRILFVDDCSTDNTFATLQAEFAANPAVTVVRHDVNRGVSAAILTGLKHADTEIVCSMDCDCSYDPHELANMLPLLTDDVAMVTASPYHRQGTVRNVPAWRLLLSRGLSAIYQRLLKQTLATWTSCFRVYRRSEILDLPLHEDGFLGTAELAAQLVLHSRRIAEHPATLEVRLFGFSKMKTIKAILSHLRLLTYLRGTMRTAARSPSAVHAS